MEKYILKEDYDDEHMASYQVPRELYSSRPLEVWEQFQAIIGMHTDLEITPEEVGWLVEEVQRHQGSLKKESSEYKALLSLNESVIQLDFYFKKKLLHWEKVEEAQQ
jgi:hypothetical protein